MKYEDALKRAKSFYDDPDCRHTIKWALEKVFPELAKPEDERIRKQLLEMVHDFTGDSLWVDYNIHKEDAIAWLEKQGEKKFAKNIVEAWKDMRLEVYQQASGNRHEPNYSDDTTKMFSLNDIDEIIEKMSEQKPIDKVEPKFKVGDWLVHKDMVGVLCCITQIHAPHYYLTNNNSFIKFSEEDNYRPWTIEDAKDGDVLVGADNIIIYGGYINNYGDRIGNKAILAYCGWNGEQLVINKKKKEGFGGIGYVPATKEQRDLLFQKMHEAGYEWDAEKLELKKIEEKPILDVEIPFGAKDSELEEVSYNIPNGYHAEIEDNKVVIKKGEQKFAEWSEEDETRLTNILIMLKEGASLHFNKKDITKAVDWLKSLEDRVQLQPRQEYDDMAYEMSRAVLYDKLKDSLNPQNKWKPSKEQMDILCKVSTYGVLASSVRDVLQSLYNDLKKL